MKKLFGAPEILTINYSRTPEWHEEVLKLTDGIGVDLVVENGGSSSLVKSLKCTRRGGIVSQVGYLGKQKPEDLQELVSTIIDRRVILRFVMDDSSAARNANLGALGALTPVLYLTWKISVPLWKLRK